MIRRLIKKLSDVSRRRRVAKLRRTFAAHGYPVDNVDDKTLDNVLKHDEGVTEPLAARSIYFALRRLTDDQEERLAAVSDAIDERTPRIRTAI